MKEELTEEERAILKHLAQSTYDAMLAAAAKLEKLEKAKAAARLAKKIQVNIPR